MKNYSLKKNLSYMAMAFYKPKQIIDIFLKETSFLYSAVPLIIFTIFYEILYILDYLFEVPGFIHIIAKVFQIPDVQYNLYQIFLFPVIHVVDFFIFFGIIYAISRLLRSYRVDILKTVFFFIFIFNTIGLLAAVAGTLYFMWKLEFLIYIEPICGVIFIIYLMEFIHKQAEINRWKSLVLCVMSLTITLAFRLIFLG